MRRITGSGVKPAFVIKHIGKAGLSPIRQSNATLLGHLSSQIDIIACFGAKFTAGCKSGAPFIKGIALDRYLRPQLGQGLQARVAFHADRRDLRLVERQSPIKVIAFIHIDRIVRLQR